MGMQRCHRIAGDDGIKFNRRQDGNVQRLSGVGAGTSSRRGGVTVHLPTSYLEKTRGRILGPAESVRIASKVQAVRATSSRYLPFRIPMRAKAFLALTDKRLLLVGGSLRARRARVLFEWPNHDLHFTATREKVGSGLIHVALPGGGSIDFERIGGEPARRWSNLHLRRLQPR